MLQGAASNTRRYAGMVGNPMAIGTAPWDSELSGRAPTKGAQRDELTAEAACTYAVGLRDTL